MDKHKVWVYAEFNSRNIYFNLRPLLKVKSRRIKINFVCDYNAIYNLKNELIFFVNDKIEKSVIKICKKNHNKIVLFDLRDSSRIHYHSVIKYADLYFTNLKYRQEYSNKFFEYSAYEIMQRNEENDDFLSIEKSKINVIWNLEYGLYPQKLLLFRFGTFIAKISKNPKLSLKFVELLYFILNIKVKSRIKFKSTSKVHAIFKNHNNNSQRNKLKNIIKNDSDFISKRVKRLEFYKLLRKTRYVLSPFGYGEICYRDYETILARNLLVKPSMNDFILFNDIFKPNKTYVPLNWDLSNLHEIHSKFYSNLQLQKYIINNSYESLKKVRKNIEKDTENFLLNLINLIKGDSL